MTKKKRLTPADSLAFSFLHAVIALCGETEQKELKANIFLSYGYTDHA